MGRIKHALCTGFHVGVYTLSRIVPVDKKVWVFGAWKGTLFSDNTKYMYNYVRENHPEIEVVWITKDKELAHKMREQGYVSYYYHEWMGVIKSLRASVVFTTAGYGDVAEWAHSKSLHISLWHGTPLKKIGFDNTGWNKVITYTKTQRFKQWILPYVNRKNEDVVYIVSSDEVKRKYLTAFHAREDQIAVLGQPRNDVFSSDVYVEHPFFTDLKKNNPNAKILCYMPTHRNFGTKNDEILTGTILKETDKTLRENNVILILKPHYHEMKNYIHLASDFTNIILGIDVEVFSDPYAFLPSCDLLISDYSSVYVDFLCSGKPVVLFPYDLDDYLKTDAGLYYEYEEIAPGSVCFTWNDVIKVAIMESQTGQMSEKYNKIKVLFNKYNDGNNCERVFQYVQNKLKEKK